MYMHVYRCEVCFQKTKCLVGLRAKESKSKEAAAQHGLWESRLDQSRWQGRWTRKMGWHAAKGHRTTSAQSLCWLNFRAPSWNNPPMTLNRPTIKEAKKNMCGHRHKKKHNPRLNSQQQRPCTHIISVISIVILSTAGCEDNLQDPGGVAKSTFKRNTGGTESNHNDTHYSPEHNRLVNLTRSFGNTPPITLQIPNMVTDKATHVSNRNNVGPWQYIPVSVWGTAT